jgi:hypothetical protein
MKNLIFFFIAVFTICIFAATYIFYDENSQQYATEKIIETHCDFEIRLGEKEEFGVFPLISLPGSGNT